ncbi:MAG: hypothetical protein LIO62_02385 [Clostridiales bacterium]|nr:hypothetical protein [Clostridiales bacterium]
MNNTCPKCGQKLSPLYMKENCPKCGVNLLYYNLDENLKADAENARREVEAVTRFLNIIKSSSIASPILIIRLVLFFTPLASMCLPMYGDISLIALIMGLINGELEISSVIMPLISMALVVVLSLAVIISSLFSSTKTGFLRNMIFSVINTAVFVGLGVIIGGIGLVLFVTLSIYILEFVMHIIC